MNTAPDGEPGIVIDALYVHIPFCHAICPFCAFAVHRHRTDLHPPYLQALLREAALRSAEFEGGRQRIGALYLGGGTPSTLSLDAVARLLEGIRAAFTLLPEVEVAFEMNPEDVTPDYLRGLVALGVNRVSLGLQSLHDTTLRALGRNNEAAQGRTALQRLQAHGPSNYNVDLMFGAPETDAEAFRKDVVSLAAWGVPHLSFYALDLEEHTLFGRNERMRRWVAQHRDEQADLYLWAARYLKHHGYRHYEVSNFCRPGQEGRQNLVVWNGGNYLGVGVGAHSHVAGQRWHNERHIRPYQRRLEAGELPVAYQERLTPAQRANEALMLSLRRDTGLVISRWESEYGVAWGEERHSVVRRLVAEGLAHLSGDGLTLTDRGFLVADGVTEALMVA